MTRRRQKYNTTSTFNTSLSRSGKDIRRSYKARLNLFLKNHQDPKLKDHQMSGKLKNYRCFNIKGEWITIYSYRGGKLFLELITTHTDLNSIDKILTF